MSKLIYLIQLWGGSPQYLLNLLQKLQNRAARQVTKLPWFTPVATLLTQCGWLSINQLVIYHSLLQIYKTRMSEKPGYLHEIISKPFPAETRLSKSGGIKYTERVRSDLGQSNFTFRAITQWNDLPPHIRQMPKLPQFKTHLKSWVKANIEI